MAIYLLTPEPSDEEIEAIGAKLTSIVPELRKIRKIEDVAVEIRSKASTKVIVVFVSPALSTEGIDKIVNIVNRYGQKVFFILISNEISGADYKRLIRSGAAEWVAANGSLEEIPELIYKQNLASDAAKHKDARPTFVSFLPCMGGVGNTTVALEAALQIKLAKATQSWKICYLDLDFQTSHVCDYLDIEARLQIHEMLDRPERLDEQLFELFISHHACGLDILAAPRSKLDPCEVSADALDPLLEMISQKYDFVVLDLPVPWFSWTSLTVENSNAVVITGINTIPCLRQMRATLDAVLEAKASSAQVAVVMNRVTRHLLGGIERRGHVESVFPSETVFYVEENRGAVGRVNTGTPAGLAGIPVKDFAKIVSFCTDVKQKVGSGA